MKTIDFTELNKRKKTYAGANGNKISVIYEGEQYMLKFPVNAKRNEDMSYSNGCFSEYIGCKIYKSIGVPVQEVLLGKYKVKGKDKIVVACKDFTEPGVTLQDFASLKNRMIDSERQGYGTELTDILQTIEEQQLVDSQSLMERFWDMFIVDAFIGNWDRHNGNWGFLYDDRLDEIALAPVYDCGSCLYPQADEKIMEAVLSDKAQMNKRIFDVPLSAINSGGKKMRYFDFISSLEYDECNTALERILDRINMKQIITIIEETPFISDLQKRFYITMLKERKARILDFSLDKLKSKQ